MTGSKLNYEARSAIVPTAESVVLEPTAKPSTLFLRSNVTSLTISLVDPDGFIAAVEGK